jgi:hypothetical protein
MTDNNTEAQTEPILCSTCGRACVTKKQLKNHIRNIHRRGKGKETTSAAQPRQQDQTEEAPAQETISVAQPQQGAKTGEASTGGLYCAPCDQTFNTQNGLDRHNGTKHSSKRKKTIKCTDCNKTFAVQLALEQHQRQKHGIQPTAEDPDDWDDSDVSGNWESDSSLSHDEEGRDLMWPEHGEPVTGLLSCLGRVMRCPEKFNKGSEVVRHIEQGYCRTEWSLEDVSSVFNKKMAKEGRHLLDRKAGDLYKCPRCKGTGRGKYTELSDLFEHAESGDCGLRVRTGPLHDVFMALLEFSVELAMRNDTDSDDYCWEYGDGAFLDSDEELFNYKMTGDISESYLARHGY